MPQHQTPQQREFNRETARFGRNGVAAGLRRAFEGVTQQPVPDQWLALLRRADDRKRMN